jgi:hypothetical protein
LETGAAGATTRAAAADAAGGGAHRLTAGRAAGDALALAGVKLGLVDKPMLAKMSSSGSGIGFLGAGFGTGFLLPRLVILLIGADAGGDAIGTGGAVGFDVNDMPPPLPPRDEPPLLGAGATGRIGSLGA